LIERAFTYPPSNLKWLRDRTIFLTKGGSHSYGLNGPDSDLDLRGILIPPKEYLLGFNNRIEQVEFKGDPDIVVFDIRKWFKLAADGNPNCLEQIFTDPEDWIWMSGAGEAIVANKELFLSKNVRHTFVGFASSQLGRIKRHRGWLLNPIEKKPERADYGLGEDPEINKARRDVAMAAIRHKMEEWDVDMGGLSEAGKIALQDKISESLAEQGILQSNQWVNAGKAIGLSDVFIEILDKENRFNTALTEWKQYQNWKENRNPERAAMEAKFGYDGKHALHLVRLCRMGKEILEGKGLIVKRPDREELLSIKAGAWSYERLVEYSEGLKTDIRKLVDTSPLPNTPDMKKLDALCVELVERYV